MFWKKNKEFKSLQELMDTAKFKEIIEKAIKLRRLKGAETLNGTDETVRLRNNAFSSLDKMDMLTPERLGAEFLRIDMNESEFPAAQRKYIRSVVENAIVGTLEFYQK